jgi:hypothetical protein
MIFEKRFKRGFVMKKMLFLALFLFSGVLSLNAMENPGHYPEFYDRDRYLEAVTMKDGDLKLKIIKFLTEEKSNLPKVKRISFDWCTSQKLQSGEMDDSCIQLIKTGEYKTRNALATNAVAKFEKYIRSKDGIEFRLGNSCVVLLCSKKVFGKKFALYIPITDFRTCENYYSPYPYQSINRTWYYITYKNVKKMFNITRFEVRKFELVKFDEEDPSNSVICADYLDFTDDEKLIGGTTAHKKLRKIFYDAFTGKDDSALEFVHNLLVTVHKVRLWDIAKKGSESCNAVLVYKTIGGVKKLVLVNLDCEDPALTGSFRCYKEKDGKYRLDAPWGKNYKPWVALPSASPTRGFGIRQILNFAMGLEENHKLGINFANYLVREFASSDDQEKLTILKLKARIKEFDQVEDVLKFLK